MKNAIEFDKPAYTCFVDLTKAFDKVQLGDVIVELKRKGIHPKIIETIRQLNTGNHTTIKTKPLTTDQIEIKKGIRQGDTLSSLLFNFIMDNII